MLTRSAIAVLGLLGLGALGNAALGLRVELFGGGGQLADGRAAQLTLHQAVDVPAVVQEEGDRDTPRVIARASPGRGLAVRVDGCQDFAFRVAPELHPRLKRRSRR